MSTSQRHLKLLKKLNPFYVANKAVLSESFLPVEDKFTQKTFTKVSMADKKKVEEAILKGHDCFKKSKQMPSFKRKEILKFIAREITSKKEEFAEIISMESGKTEVDAQTEVKRSIETFEIAAEESTRIYGEQIPLDLNKESADFFGMVKRFPIGLVSMISPFNFPLNLVAHKVGPAIAAGCPFILKPSIKTPISALYLAEILSQTELPEGFFSVVCCKNEDAQRIVTDERIKLLSFTGSSEVGWNLKEKCGRKKVILELGGNAACIIDSDVDIQHAAQRVAVGAFSNSGQSCISVQRLYVHEKIYKNFKSVLIKNVKKLNSKICHNKSSKLGPLISKNAVDRCVEWIKEAKNQGGKILIGGKAKKNFLEATVVENVNENCSLFKKEIFGPVCTIESYSDFKKAISKTNNSKFGLQAGIFTNNLQNAFYAYETLEVGGVVLNDVPTKRIDAMPYGGVKWSGTGKEGVKYSIHEMTEPKLFLFNNSLPK